MASADVTPIDEVLERRTLPQQVAARLTALIQSGSLTPGDFLASENQLSREFGVSRPVVREALRLVAAQGFVEVLNGRGAVVRSLAPDPLLAVFLDAVGRRRSSLVQLMELRNGIETHAAALAAERRTDDEAERLAVIARQMGCHLNDFDGYNELDFQLHLAVAAATHNAMIGHLMASLQETLRTSIREGFRHRQSPAVLRRTQRLHLAIVETIQSRSPLRARRAMQRHFDDAIAAIMTRPPAEIVRSRTGARRER